MYKRITLKLTLLFVALSFPLFLALAAMSSWLFYQSETRQIDTSIHELLVHVADAVDDDGKTMNVPLARSVAWKYSSLFATVELFDVGGKLMQSFGPHPMGQLYSFGHDDPSRDVLARDGHRIRVGSHEIFSRINNRRLGFMQVGLATQVRDQSLQDLITQFATTVPIMLALMAVCGYYLASKASEPVERTFALLQQFLNDAGHELKTPIHIVQLTAENVEEYWDDPELKQELSVIKRATDRMGRLVEDMTMLAKMEVQKLELNQESLRLDELVRNVYADFRNAFESKSIRLELRQVLPATVRGDSNALHRLFTNLLQNALRYTEAGGTVTVSMHGTTEEITVDIADTGMGIPTESLPKIFDRFYRVDAARSREAGGSGLGLAIVQVIAQKHEGRVRVESELGKGSTFSVVLPVANVSVQNALRRSIVRTLKPD